MAVLPLVLTVLKLYGWILFARAIISWIPNLDPYHPVIQFLYRITEPVLEPIRKLVPPLGGTVDISMIIAFLGIWVLQQMLSRLV